MIQAKYGSILFCFAQWHSSVLRSSAWSCMRYWCLLKFLSASITMVIITILFPWKQRHIWDMIDCVWHPLCGTNWYQRQQKIQLRMTVSSCFANRTVLMMVDLLIQFCIYIHLLGLTGIKQQIVSALINNIHIYFWPSAATIALSLLLSTKV